MVKQSANAVSITRELSNTLSMVLGCGDERRSLPGVITSPAYPSDYPHQRECVWTIVAPDNHQVILNVTDFLLEQHVDCNFDYLEIR